MEVMFPPLLKAASETAALTTSTKKYLESKKKVGEVAGGRIVNWKIAFANSHKAVTEITKNDKDFTAKKAYGLFKGLSLFEGAIAFEDGKEHDRLRALFQKQSYITSDMSSTIQNVLAAISRKLDTRLVVKNAPVEIYVYKLMKAYAIDCLSVVFIGLEIDKIPQSKTPHDYHVVSRTSKFPQLQSTFWKGSCSSGLNMNFFGLTSAFNKAKTAKKKILKIITDSNLNAHSPANDELSDQEKSMHHLLFASSMVSKTLASLLTTFFLVAENNKELQIVKKILDEDKQSKQEYLNAVIKEILRLYPPIIGCCRYCEKDTVVDKYQIKKGQYVWCSFLTAHTDEKVFKEPQKFMPNRWLGQDTKQLPQIFSMGAYGKACLGERLVFTIIKECILHFCRTYKWTLSKDQNLKFRWLPVARPLEGLKATISKR